jgi:hypothetical protein
LPVATNAAIDLAFGDLATVFGVILTGLSKFAQSIEHAKALEGIFAIEELALVDLAQVTLDERARQGRTPEKYGQVGHTALVHQFQVLAHYEG